MSYLYNYLNCKHINLVTVNIFGGDIFRDSMFETRTIFDIPPLSLYLNCIGIFAIICFSSVLIFYILFDIKGYKLIISSLISIFTMCIVTTNQDVITVKYLLIIGSIGYIHYTWDKNLRKENNIKDIF
ncbi:hypothetical protein OD350_28565 (plasmid) [Clostridium beijerinckii]|uniref:hypothetical protein n=1 Tax=Clostridium beijerinckii TaxID=1520 RepID=UPI002226C66F|nr:hypothetical protein [Clostridium beijerinckii]UYZ39027.1 hypothetical protein OD350_28565 [Clostridium beijerinckii]